MTVPHDLEEMDKALGKLQMGESPKIEPRQLLAFLGVLCKAILELHTGQRVEREVAGEVLDLCAGFPLETIPEMAEPLQTSGYHKLCEDCLIIAVNTDYPSIQELAETGRLCKLCAVVVRVEKIEEETEK